MFGEVAQVQGRLDRLSSQGDRMEHQLRQLADRLGDFEDRQVRRQAEFAAEIETRLAALPGIFGPRLDEIEIKSRPMIEFDDSSYAIRLRDGYAMAPRSEPTYAVMIANATSGGLEPGTRRVLQALIEPGMSAADVGANIGLLTLACAVATGPSGKVYAFEPEAGPRLQLEKTCHLNGLAWVDVSDLAVGAAAGQAIFNISPIIGHSSLYALPEDEVAGGQAVQVEVRPLDDVVPPGRPLDVVKMDVEGAELDVLAGMARLLAENADLAIVAEFGPSHLARIGTSAEQWFQAFHDRGFRAFEIAEPTGLCRPVTHSDLTEVMSANIAFVQPRGRAIGRLPR
jgi:FkbM family methyltransferase